MTIQELQTRHSSKADQKLDSFHSQRFIGFTLNGEEYAIPLLKVKEVIALTEITPMPYTPPYLKGIMNLRGQVISVIDLRLKFKMSKAETTPETTIVILDLSPLSIGVIVDSVESVLAVQADELKPPPHMDIKISTDYVAGVIRRQEKLILVVDVEKTLSVEDLKVIQSES